MNDLVPRNFDFERSKLTVIRYLGRPAFVARHVGVALGYSHNGKRFASKLTADWADEFIEGTDFAYVTGDALAALKELGERTETVPSKANRGLMVLFESGLHLALAKTHMPAGRRLRRFLVDDVLPQIARDGRYAPDRRVVDGQLVARVELANAAERERRLAEQHALKLRRFRVDNLRRTVRMLHTLGKIDADVLATYEVLIAEMALERELPDLRPRASDGWASPGQIAGNLEVNPHEIEVVLLRLGLRGYVPGLARPVLTKSPDAQTALFYEYSPAAVQLIAQDLRENRRAA